MNEDIYDDIVIEKIAQQEFGVKLDIDKVYARSIPVSRSAQATVLLTTKNKLYSLITATAPLTLGDVRKIILRMGLRAEAYCPPRSQPQYFHEQAIDKFKTVYPGRHDITDTDLRFYRLMAPYSPALVQVAEITGGVIHQFDPMADTGWRPSAKATYRQIKAK